MTAPASRYRLRGIRERIIAYFGILSLLVSAALVLVMMYGAPWLGIEGVYRLKEAEIVHALENAADVKKQSILTWLSGRRTELAVIVNSGDFVNATHNLAHRRGGEPAAGDPEVALLSAHLHALKQTSPELYDNLALVTRDGKIAASSDPELVRRPYPFPEFIVDAYSVGATEQIGTARQGGHPVVLISRQVPVRDRAGQETGEVAAVIVAQTRPQQSLESLALLPGLSASRGTCMVMVGPKGELLASVPELAPEPAQEDPLVALLVSRGMSRTESSREEALTDGRELLAAYRYVPIGASEGWGIAIAMDKEQAFAPLTATRSRASLFGLGMIALALVLVGLAAGRIARPIWELRSTVSALEDGDFTARAGPGNLGSDEIGQLALAFNSMAQRIENWHKELEQQVAQRTRELRLEKETAQGYLDVAGVMLIMIERTGRIRMINRTGASLLGGTEHQLIGLDWFDNFVPPEDRAELQGVFGRLMQGEQQLLEFYENKVLTRSNGERLFAWHNKLLYGQGGDIIGVLSSGEDITQKRRAEVERLELERQLLHTQKLESLGVLAGGIAHDFNNLLMAISGNLELIRYVIDLGTPAQKYIDNALQASKRAANLTRQMLAYSGKGGYCVKLVDLNRLVGENVDLMRVSLRKGVILSAHLQSVLPPFEADPGQMQQVIVNLVTNAAEAIGEGGGTINVATGVAGFPAAALAKSRLEQKPAPGEFLFVEVADSGCGMDPESCERMFDPFFSTKFTGRGLGLSAVLGIVRGHAGTILVDTAPGSGTTVKVLFPAPVSVASTKESAAEVAAVATVAVEAGAVLIVDDEEMVRQVCRAMVRGLGYRTMVASDGAEAVALFREHAEEVATVIMDLSMPHMDGMTAAAEIRRIRPEVGIVLSSGFSAEEAARKMAGHGSALFIQKPYDLASLEEVLGLCPADRADSAEGDVDLTA